MALSEDITGMARDVTTKLPREFLALVCVNVVFILGLMFFVHDVAITRIEAVTRIVTTCTNALAAIPPTHP